MQQDDPFAIDRMRDRLAILDAMSTVMERRQELMDVVASAADGDAARGEVSTRFGFSEVQALAVLDLQVRRFSERERRRIVEQAEEMRRELG
jgi:DNA gyrase subunit A